MSWKLRRIEASPRTGKKWRAIFYDPETQKEKHTDFGATGYDDFTTAGAKDLKSGDPTKAGFLSYYILWNKPTLTGGVRDYKSRFNM